MRSLSLLVVLAAAGMLASTVAADAATSPAMKSCSAQWSDMKMNNKLPPGQKWTDFWSRCSKDYAAKNGAGGASTAAATSSRPKKLAAVAEDDSSNSAQQKKDCDARWNANKTKTGAHGWHAYFQFMSSCM
jgi:hypothetical protein